MATGDGVVSVPVMVNTSPPLDPGADTVPVNTISPVTPASAPVPDVTVNWATTSNRPAGFAMTVPVSIPASVAPSDRVSRPVPSVREPGGSETTTKSTWMVPEPSTPGEEYTRSAVVKPLPPEPVAVPVTTSVAAATGVTVDIVIRATSSPTRATTPARVTAPLGRR